jgi:Complex 1 protein (LYR family)
MSPLTMTRPAFPSRFKILHLYKQCLRSVQRIPEADQRLTYLSYTRLGFRDKQHLVPDSKHAVIAFKDAEEQSERMNYYHSVREEQLRIATEKRQATAPAMVDAPKAEDAFSETDEKSQAIMIIRQWLLEAIPDLKVPDTSRYIQRLIDDGFDTVTLLRNQLQIEDLEFMKKGHKRAVAKTHLTGADHEQKGGPNT